MMQRTLIQQLLVSAVFLGLFLIRRDLEILPTLFFFLGMVIAHALLWFDEYRGYTYYQPEERADGFSKILISRSLLFLIILMPLSIFVASSTGSTIGQGFVFTLLSVLSIEMLSVYRRQDLFNNRFAQQAKKPLSPQEITYAVGACMLVTLCVGGIILI